jgi:hypothetical protein
VEKELLQKLNILIFKNKIMKRDYRVVTNGKWYEIEYRYKLWPFWFRHKPSLYNRMDAAGGYQPIDYDSYMFSSVTEAVRAIESLRKQDKGEVWETVVIERY